MTVSNRRGPVQFRQAFVVGAIGIAGALVLPLTATTAQSPPDVVRIAGDSRVGTAIAVSQFGYPDGSDAVYVARDDAFPDALAAGGLSGGPILLAPSCGPIGDALAGELRRLNPTTIYPLGGELALSDSTLRQLRQMDSDDTATCPVAGVRIDVERIASDSVRVMVVNDSTNSIEVGRSYVLSIRRDGAFEPLDPPVGPFQSDLQIVAPGSSSEPQTVGPDVVRDGDQVVLEPGDYQLVMTIGGADYSATFTIG